MRAGTTPKRPGHPSSLLPAVPPRVGDRRTRTMCARRDTSNSVQCYAETPAWLPPYPRFPARKPKQVRCVLLRAPDQLPLHVERLPVLWAWTPEAVSTRNSLARYTTQRVQPTPARTSDRVLLLAGSIPTSAESRNPACTVARAL